MYGLAVGLFFGAGQGKWLTNKKRFRRAPDGFRAAPGLVPFKHSFLGGSHFCSLLPKFRHKPNNVYKKPFFGVTTHKKKKPGATQPKTCGPQKQTTNPLGFGGGTGFRSCGPIRLVTPGNSAKVRPRGLTQTLAGHLLDLGPRRLGKSPPLFGLKNPFFQTGGN